MKGRIHFQSVKLIQVPEDLILRCSNLRSFEMPFTKVGNGGLPRPWFTPSRTLPARSSIVATVQPSSSALARSLRCSASGSPKTART